MGKIFLAERAPDDPPWADNRDAEQGAAFPKSGAAIFPTISDRLDSFVQPVFFHVRRFRHYHAVVSVRLHTDRIRA